MKSSKEQNRDGAVLQYFDFEINDDFGKTMPYMYGLPLMSPRPIEWIDVVDYIMYLGIVEKRLEEKEKDYEAYRVQQYRWHLETLLQKFEHRYGWAGDHPVVDYMRLPDTLGNPLSLINPTPTEDNRLGRMFKETMYRQATQSHDALQLFYKHKNWYDRLEKLNDRRALVYIGETHIGK